MVAQACPSGSVVKKLHANVGDTSSILGQEDPLEEEMTTHSSILAWKTPGTKAWQAIVHGVTKSWIRLKSLSTHE